MLSLSRLLPAGIVSEDPDATNSATKTKFGLGFRKKLGLPIGTATLMCPQSSQNRNKRRKCGNRSSELVAKQTLLQSAHQLKTKKEGELQTMRKIPVLCCPAPTPPGSYVFCTCIFIRLTLRMYQSKSRIEGCRVQYTYQISFSTPKSYMWYRRRTRAQALP
jgi:hypothetical protein